MNRLQKIRMLDRFYLFFMVATSIFAGLVINYNRLNFGSAQLLLQYSILLIVGIIGVIIWQRNKV